MSTVKEPEVNWNQELMVEVQLNEPDDFLKVRETLTRIGVASRKEKKLYQSCHILHKQGRYYIVHFKELFALDGKHAMSLTEKKRYYLGDFRHTAQQAIEWWKKKASKRYDKLTRDGRVRTKLEVWQPGVEMEIIR